MRSLKSVLPLLLVGAFFSACGEAPPEPRTCYHVPTATWTRDSESISFSGVEISRPFEAQIYDENGLACVATLVFSEDKCSSQMSVETVTSQTSPLCQEISSYTEYEFSDSTLSLCGPDGCTILTAE